MFRQTIARLGLSIEQGTIHVPNDGRYYVVDQGVVRTGFRTLKDAINVYEGLKAERLSAERSPVLEGTGE